MSIRITLRRLRATPTFSVAVVSVIALTVGASLLFTTLVSGTLFVPSTTHEPERLVRIYTADDSRPNSARGRYGTSSLLDFQDVERATRARAILAAYFMVPVTARVGGEEISVSATVATELYFEALGVPPFLGDVTTGSAVGVAVSHEFWVGRLRGAPDVVGSALLLRGVPFTIRAVMPAGFLGTSSAGTSDIWVPMAAAELVAVGESAPAAYRDDRRMSIVGRLRPGASVESIEPTLRSISTELQQLHAENARRSFVVVPFPYIFGVAERAVLGIDGGLVSMGLVLGALLVLAYANIANLFAVRGLLMAREIAIRKALGGTNAALVREAVGQVVALVLPGLLLGWLLSRLGFAAWFADNPLLARAELVSSGWTVVAVAMSGLLVTLAVGTVPAFWANAQSPDAAMRIAENDTSLKSARVLWGLVSVQVAIACCAGAVVRDSLVQLRALERVTPGFDLARIADVFVTLRAGERGAVADDIAQSFLARVRAIPGVVSVAQAEVPMLKGFAMRQAIGIAGRPFAAGEIPNVRFDVVSTNYFETIGLSMEQGRFSADAQLHSTFTEVVVNRAFADALLERGKELEGTVLLREQFPVRVVGVVRNAVYDALVEGDEPRMYLPQLRSHARGSFGLIVRTAGDAEPRVGELQRLISRDPSVRSITGVQALSTRREGILAPLRNLSWILGALALTVGCFVSIGVYGILAISLTSVRRATAIRVALGAPTRLVVAVNIRPVAIAFGAGAAMAFALSWGIRVLWLQPQPSVPSLVFVLPFVALPIATACAPLVRRMLRESPADVLRS